MVVVFIFLHTAPKNRVNSVKKIFAIIQSIPGLFFAVQLDCSSKGTAHALPVGLLVDIPLTSED